MLPGPEPAELPPDAVEVGRIIDAWGIKGWFKIQPYSASPEALFSSRRWFIQPSERGARRFEGTLRLAIREAREHGDAVVATSPDVPDRNAAEQLKGAHIFIARSSFPTPAEGEFYWVDLIGLAVVNREGVALGLVKDLLDQDADALVEEVRRRFPELAKHFDAVVFEAYAESPKEPGRSYQAYRVVRYLDPTQRRG